MNRSFPFISCAHLKGGARLRFGLLGFGDHGSNRKKNEIGLLTKKKKKTILGEMKVEK